MKNKNEIIINELEELYKNPMFRISLGSKELFHSNFLAFLWDCDKQNREMFEKEEKSLIDSKYKAVFHVKCKEEK
mgnify:CR=1 FL=1